MNWSDAQPGPRTAVAVCVGMGRGQLPGSPAGDEHGHKDFLPVSG